MTPKKRSKQVLAIFSAVSLICSMFGNNILAQMDQDVQGEEYVEVQDPMQEETYTENQDTDDVYVDPEGEYDDSVWHQEDAMEYDDTVGLNGTPIIGKAENSGVTITVTAPAGSFPEGTSVNINPLSQEDTQQRANDIQAGAEAVGFDITFLDLNGIKVQPDNGKTVNVSFFSAPGSMMSSEEENAALRVYHVADTGEAELMKETDAPGHEDVLNVSVEANSFSTYLLLKDSESEEAMKAQSRQAKELTNVISDIKLWEVNEGRYVLTSGGSYQLVQGNPYRYEVDFDLTAYNGDLENGDTFTFTIPEPITVADGTILLKHDETGIVVGSAEVVSNGDSKGGVVKVTLQNLDEYLNQTGGTEVRDLKGTFYVEFSVSEIVTNETINYNSSETVDAITHNITVKEKGSSDYSETIGKSNFNKFGGVFTERPYSSAILGKSGNYVHPWFVRVNVRQASYDTITIFDTISNEHAPMQYIPESLRISYGYYNSSYSFDYEGYLVEGTDYTITYNSSYTAFEIIIPNASSREAVNGKPASYQLSYDTTAPADGSSVANTVQVNGDETELTISTDRPQTSTTIERISKVTQGGTISLDVAYRIVLYKIDSSTGNMLEGAVFKVITPAGEEIELPATDENGRTYSRVFTSQEASQGDFTIVEVVAPNGFKLLDDPITVKVGSEGAIKTIGNEPAKTEVSVTKVWNDNNNQDGLRPLSITVKLIANDTDTGKTVQLNAANNWTASFTDLDEYQGGEKIIYRVEEQENTGYTVDISGDMETGYTITNTHEPEVIEINGSKTWDDNNNQDGARPEAITINLLADGEPVNSVTVTEADSWSWSFVNLPKYANEGTEIVYSITEDAVTGYTTEYNGYDVVNTHAPGKTSISVTKAWNDNNNQDGIRPLNITVKLIADDADTGKTVQLNAANNWTASFTDLDENKDGKKISYRVEEEDVAGYTVDVIGDMETGYTITNTHEPEVIEINGSKTWDDTSNQDGLRPEEITINLLADGKPIDSIKVTEADDWSWSFVNLPKYADEGTEIVYSITEDAVENYTTEYNGYDVVNTHAPGKTSISVTKAWNDNNNQDGIRPLNITVKLFADDADTGKTVELNAANNWTASFTDLDENKDGKKISYRVEEEDVAGYTVDVIGDMETGYTITNTHEPEVIEINGSKTWDDTSNQDGLRPEEITINLLADGKPIDSIKVTEADDWSWSFVNLPKYANEGTEIVYSITEDAVENYTTEYNGYDVVNTHAPGKTTITVTKAWTDNNNQDGLRPKEVVIHLLADGVDTQMTLTLNEANKWVGTFDELDLYKDGKQIVYTISEEPVNGYVTTIRGNAQEGFTVTNTKSTSPKTGIFHNFIQYYLMLIAAIAGMFIVFLKSIRQKAVK